MARRLSKGNLAGAVTVLLGVVAVATGPNAPLIGVISDELAIFWVVLGLLVLAVPDPTRSGGGPEEDRFSKLVRRRARQR